LANANEVNLQGNLGPINKANLPGMNEGTILSNHPNIRKGDLKMNGGLQGDENFEVKQIDFKLRDSNESPHEDLPI